ncbi:MAG TPA: hypothetical protein VMW72_06655, partial [Sedimentisphaerales bacterium]|nr:hypothetical protein [Sedimentisphaerales bacterium]
VTIFAERTKKGVAMGAGRNQIITTYGEPDRTASKEPFTILYYDNLRSEMIIANDKQKLRDDNLVDIDTHNLSQVRQRFNNMMWYCGITNLTNRDILIKFIESFQSKLSPLPRDESYCKTGFRPDGGYSKFLFLTRESSSERVEKAFLRFSKENDSGIIAKSPLGASYKISKDCLVPSLRTPVGVQTMNLSKKYDYIIKKRYEALKRVCQAAGINMPDSKYLGSLTKKIKSVKTHIAISHRINPFSPDNYHVAFFSSKQIAPSDQMNILIEPDREKAQSMCVILNSVLFFTQFFLLKEESTGRYINIRVYDLEEMHLVPSPKVLKALTSVFIKFAKTKFTSLRQQFDENFDQRYEEFWEYQRGERQGRLFSVLDKPVKPSKNRLNFDLAVCKAIDLDVAKKDLIQIYEVLIREMIIIKGLKRD